MKDLLKRFRRADPQVIAHLIARGAFPKVARTSGVEVRGSSDGNPKSADLKNAGLRYRDFIPALAIADRQLAIHAVVNARLTDVELARLEKLVALQTDGHLLRQLRVAIEIETKRRKTHGYRAGGNRVANRRG